MYKGTDKTYKIIGICVSALHDDMVRDIAMTLSRKANEKNYKVFLFNSFTDLYNENDYTKGESSVFTLAETDLLDAVVILPESIRNASYVKKIADHAKLAGKPIVSVDGLIEGVPSVAFDAGDTFEKIVRHVVEDHGCKKINFVAGVKDNAFSDERINCFKKVLAENNIEFEPQRLGYGDFWGDPARKVAEQFLKSELSLPDAIICCNDAMAISVCQVLRKNGIKIPEDIIVTGFDGIEAEKYISPRLTTAAPDIEDLVDKAMDILEHLINGDEVPLVTHASYHMRLSQSCGCRVVDNVVDSDKIIDMYNIISAAEGHEAHMLNYLGKAMCCSNIDELSTLIHYYGDYCTWCCLNTDFLDKKSDKTENGFFTENMYNLVHNVGEFDFTYGEIFPRSELVYNVENALENFDYIMFVPLHFQSDVVGYIGVMYDLNCFNFKNTKRFVNYTNQIMESLKNRINLAKANAMLEDMHVRDVLTGIYNRRGFYNNAVAAIEKYKDTDKNIVLFSVDMDGLKKINDTFGHHEGDNAINSIAHALLAASNNGEICARFGGDEFLVLGVSESNNIDKYCADYYNKVNEKLAEYDAQNNSPYKVKISCGTVGVKCGSIDELDEFIKIADENMYREKRKHKIRSGAGTINCFNRMIDLLVNKSSAAFFYINFDEHVWEIGENAVALKCMISDKYDPVEAILRSGAVYSDDLELYRGFYNKLLSGTTAGIHDSYMKIHFRAGENGKMKWYNMLVSFVKNEKDLIYEVVGSIHQMTDSELMARNILNAYTNDRHPTLFGSMIEKRLKDDPDSNYAIIQFDVVRFKLINDTYGEAKGTELLNYFNDVLGVFCSEKQLFSRLSADVFMILTPYEKQEDIERFIRTLEKCLSGFEDMSYSFAFGVYFINNKSLPSRMMGDAAAIARIKIKGNALENIGYYTEDQKIEIKVRKEIEDKMNNALENKEFIMYLQPKYSISENTIIGAEALVRWIQPNKGVVCPQEFIPIFEQNGFIVKLDRYMWECACKEMRRWIDKGYEPVPISVNVSRMHLKDAEFIYYIEYLLDKYGIEKDLLELEITETIENINANMMVKEAKKHGFTLLMDDFGSGYSSLNTLKSTPFDVLKIDRSFLNSFMESSRGQKIISHTIAMSHDIGLDLIAEGVETREQADFLSASGCNAAQGFYFSKPIPTDEFEMLLKAQIEKNK